MLKPDYFMNKSDKMVEIYQELENFIMRDIANRLLTSGEMSGTADRLIWKLRMMGESREAIQKKLSEITGLSKAELKALLQDAVMTSWDDDKSTYAEMGIDIVSPLDSQAVIRVMDAEYRKSKRTLDNLTRTTMEQSQKDLIRMLDEAEMRTASGVQSYSAAVCDVLDRYAGDGFVIYPSIGKDGKKYKMTLEAAVNMIVRTSLNQTAAQVTNQYIVEAETNYVLVSAHYGARVAQKGQTPLADHSEWQGKPYCIRGSEDGFPNLLESTGYDITPDGTGRVVNPLGLHGYNCRHSHQPWDKSLKNPWVDDNGNPIIDTKESREKYENEQKQRAMERAIRKTKRELLMKEEELKNPGDADVEKLRSDYDRIASKLRRRNEKYNDFCESKNLKKQHDRIKVAGFKREQAAKAMGAARRFENEKDNHVAKSADSDIIKSGARNPIGIAASEHAKKYYGLVRKMKTDVSKIAKITGRSEKQIEEIKNYLFIDKHDLGELGVRRFDPDYMIAQSWQRLIDGKPEYHDIVLINHEIMERDLVRNGMSQEEAHITTSKKYNYDKEARDFYGKIKKYKKG